MTENRALTVIAVVAVIFLLHWGQTFFIPLFIAILIAYALAPAASALTVVVRFRPLAAGLVVLAALAVLGLAVWSFADDVERMVEQTPAAAKAISKSLQKLSQQPGPVRDMQKAATEVEAVARTGRPPPAAAPPPPAPTPPMSMWQLMWKGWQGLMQAGAGILVVTFLVFFILASGDLFKRKLIGMAGPRLSQKKFTLQVIDAIDLQVRRYLGLLAISNVVTGVLTWLVFRFLGVEYAELWGIAAGILNTAPYFGPSIVAVASFGVTLVQSNDLVHALSVAGSTLVVQGLVNTLFDTFLAAYMTRMNAAATFVGLLFFGALWGIWGILLGIPLLAIVKVICDHNEDWKPLGELLGR